MLLRVFRLNDPYRLLGIFILLILVSLGYFIDPVEVTLVELKSMVIGEILNDGNALYSELFTSTAPLTAWFYGWIEWLFGRSTLPRHIFALILLFFQGAFFAILLINNKAQNESTYLPALIFGVLCLFSFDMLALTPELLGATVLLFALNNLFKEVEFRIQRDSIVLNLGFYLGIASLMVMSYVVFLPGALAILLLYTRTSLRKVLLLLFGFLLPHVLVITFYFLKGDLNLLWHNFYAGSKWFEANQMPLTSLVYLSAIPLAYFVFSLIMLNREARLTKYQSQLLQIMFLWLVVAVVEIFLAGNMAPHRVITYAPPLAYFTSHFLLLIRRKWISETLLWIFVVGILFTGYLARYNAIPGIMYQQLFCKESPYANQITGKRVFVIGSDWGIYIHNNAGSYFLEWELSSRIFSGLDHFDNVVLVNQSFEEGNPDVIIDQAGKMPEVLNRIPRLRQQYKQQDILYIRK